MNKILNTTEYNYIQKTQTLMGYRVYDGVIVAMGTAQDKKNELKQIKKIMNASTNTAKQNYVQKNPKQNGISAVSMAEYSPHYVVRNYVLLFKPSTQREISRTLRKFRRRHKEQKKTRTGAYNTLRILRTEKPTRHRKTMYTGN